MARTRRTRTTYPSNRSFLTGCSDRKAAGPSAMLHRSTGLSRKQIRARRRFTAVLRQSRLPTTVGLISAIAGQPALILIKSVCRFPAWLVEVFTARPGASEPHKRPPMSELAWPHNTSARCQTRISGLLNSIAGHPAAEGFMRTDGSRLSAEKILTSRFAELDHRGKIASRARLVPGDAAWHPPPKRESRSKIGPPLNDSGGRRLLMRD